MSSTTHSSAQYIKIFYILLALTVIEVAIVYLGLPKMLLAAQLVIFDVCKDALVSMQFMHLK
jgi:cytochrome c oxidase subunit IV